MESDFTLDRDRPADVDDVLPILRSHQRRAILLLLQEDDVVDETSVIARGNKDIEQVKSELVENHLPKLEEAGFIDWDREEGTITKGPRFDEIEPLIEQIQNRDDELPASWR